MKSEPVTLILTLRPDGEPFTGSATDEHGDRDEFSGWLGLVAALDSILQAQRARADADIHPRRPSARRSGATVPPPVTARRTVVSAPM